MNPKKFTVTTSWAQTMRGFDDALRLEIYDAVFEYAETGQTPELSAGAAAAFAFIRTDLDIDMRRKLELSELRRRCGRMSQERDRQTGTDKK